MIFTGALVVFVKGKKGSRIGHREIPGYKAGLGSTDLSGTSGPKWPFIVDMC